MSFTKQTLVKLIEDIRLIQDDSIKQTDYSHVLQGLDALIIIAEKFSEKDKELEPYWNEIISDSISVINCCISGHYRISISGLRNILELASHSFFFFDHKIEFKLLVDQDYKSDKYVSTLVNNYHFFTSRYIKTFYSEISQKENQEDSISKCLSSLYSELCDVVHGRYKTLTKQEALSISFSKKFTALFERLYLQTIGVIATMYILRMNDFQNETVNILAQHTKLIKI